MTATTYTTATLAAALREAREHVYDMDDHYYPNPTIAAEDQLRGISHYYSPDTRRFHSARVLECRQAADGLLLVTVESCAGDMRNTYRVYRPVVFDVTGRVIDRPSLDESYRTARAARNARDRLMSEIDAVAVTLEALRAAAQPDGRAGAWTEIATTKTRS